MSSVLTICDHTGDQLTKQLTNENVLTNICQTIPIGFSISSFPVISFQPESAPVDLKMLDRIGAADIGPKTS